MPDFNAWMLAQTEEFQDDVLGKPLADMVRAGRHRLRRYVPRRGSALTIEQAIERDKVMFKAMDDAKAARDAKGQPEPELKPKREIE